MGTAKKKKKDGAPSTRSKSAPKKTTAGIAKKSAAGKLSPKLKKIQEFLHEELKRLRTHLGLIQEEGDDSVNVGDIADAATSQEVKAALRGLQETEAHKLEKIESALQRIDEGTYGSCARCGKPIEPARLEAIPHAANCIACKRKEESGAGSPAGR